MRLPRILSITWLLISATTWGCGPDEGTRDPTRFPIIPIPADMDAGRGQFVLSPETEIALSHPGDGELLGVVDRWASGLREASGLPLPVLRAEGARGRGMIRIQLTGLPHGAQPIASGMGIPGIEAEGYELEVRAGGIELKAPGPAGVFYGLESLSQLITGPESTTPWSVPSVEIEDIPRFPYRGMHLDVGRHFFPVSFVKRYIDLLATYKMNVFHWHLTEDQGWRIEIQGYPRLTEVGSCRAETMVEKNFDPFVGDGVPYCGFYTQDEIREIVEYARERFITVMPEIEITGPLGGGAGRISGAGLHARALPGLHPMGCHPGHLLPQGGDLRLPGGCPHRGDGHLSQPLHPHRRRRSAEDRLGGQRARPGGHPPGGSGRRRGASELVHPAHRGLPERPTAGRLVGWDEILEGGLAPDATVMSWRGEAGGIQAAREGHDVIMTPNSHVYLDYYQGDLSRSPWPSAGTSPSRGFTATSPCLQNFRRRRPGIFSGPRAMSGRST